MQSNKFWELQDKLNQICASLLTYELACDMLELNQYNLMLFREREIVLKSWQVVKIVWIVDQKDDLVKNDIVINDCELSKIIFALVLIYFAVQRPHIQLYQSTIVVVSSDIVDT